MKLATHRRLKVISRQVGGYALLGAGIAGCILPIIPGIPLLFAGLALLAVDTPWAAQLSAKLKDYWQRVRRSKAAPPNTK
jgi:uncharacterized protein